mmetsp:Transcript_34286/g.88584  ORF Transcript_34286/g.88584 Transcript_34286/m.88584 type:complete len:315 (-) Transcript_34286:338-1282(-)
MLQVPQQVELERANRLFSEALLELQSIHHGQQVVLRTIRELKLVLLAEHRDAIRQVLHHLVVHLGIGVLLLLFRGVFQGHALPQHVPDLELPRNKRRNVLGFDHVGPSFDGEVGSFLLALSVDHVLDQVLDLQLLRGIQDDGVFLLRLLGFVVLALVCLLVVLCILVVFLVLLVLFIFVILLILLVFLVLVFLDLGHELAHDLFDGIDALLELEVLDVGQFLGLRVFEFGPDAAVPEPIREVQGREDAAPTHLRLFVRDVHGAPILRLVDCSDRRIFLLLFLRRLGLGRGGRRRLILVVVAIAAESALAILALA